MRELYIYYRIRRDRAEAALRAVRALQQSLRTSHPELVARLLRRDGDAELQTWMETYAFAAAPRHGMDDGVDAGLEVAIEAGAASFAALLEGPRHVEAFDADLAP